MWGVKKQYLYVIWNLMCGIMDCVPILDGFESWEYLNEISICVFLWNYIFLVQKWFIMIRNYLQKLSECDIKVKLLQT